MLVTAGVGGVQKLHSMESRSLGHVGISSNFLTLFSRLLPNTLLKQISLREERETLGLMKESLGLHVGEICPRVSEPPTSSSLK